MIQKNYISLLCLLAIASSCSMLPTKKLEVVSKPLKIDIMQPDLPRPVNLTAPKVVCSIRSSHHKSLQESGQ